MLYPEDMQGWYRTSDTYTAEDKGVYRGSCNRSCCQAPRSALYYNQSTQAFYCFKCSALINEGVGVDQLTQLRCDVDGLCVDISSKEHPHHQEFTDLRVLDKLAYLDLSQSMLLDSEWYRMLIVLQDQKEARIALRDRHYRAAFTHGAVPTTCVDFMDRYMPEAYMQCEPTPTPKPSLFDWR